MGSDLHKNQDILNEQPLGSRIPVSRDEPREGMPDHREQEAVIESPGELERKAMERSSYLESWRGRRGERASGSLQQYNIQSSQILIGNYYL